MIFRSTDKIAVHRRSIKNYTLVQTFVGSNPYGPKGGCCGNVVSGQEVLHSWWPRTEIHSELGILFERVRPGTGSIEVDVGQMIVVARYNVRYGTWAYEIKHARDEDLPMFVGLELSEYAQKLLEQRLKSV